MESQDHSAPHQASKPAPSVSAKSECAGRDSCSYSELIAGLKKASREGSAAFWTFWKTLTQKEKGMVLHGPKEEQVVIKQGGI